METLSGIIASLSGFVWGPYLLLPLLLGTGAYLMIGLKFMPIRYLGMALKYMWHGRKHDPNHEGELSPFKALMTSMAATVGTGNIVGVATAITMGGPGAIFWMWCTSLVGMATKYCEAALAVKFRDVTPNGSYVGGPMYYIRRGLGEKWAWLATIFAICGTIACFGIGNLTQANAIAQNVQDLTGVSAGMTGVVLLVLVGIVLIGGVKRVGDVAGVLVPFMAIFYILIGLLVLLLNYDKIIPSFALIFEHAFAPMPAVGGFAGAVLKDAIQRGVSRGLFSNEAGLGSAPIAHATAITDSPVRQGFLGMLDPFLDTIVICSITALVILISGEWSASGEVQKSAALLTARSFESVLPGVGKYVVSIGLILFAFSTILGWSVYGERCCIYLFGHNSSLIFRIIFSLVVPLGAMAELKLVWDISDLFNGLMALPNLIALLFLSPVVFRFTKEYFDEHHGKIDD